MKNKILFFATLLLLCIINSAKAQDTLKVKVYLEGLYRGNGMMDTAPYNADGSSPRDIADTIILKLWAYNTNNSTVINIPSYIRKGLLKTNGYASFALPSFLTNTNYYIEVSHRNSLAIVSSSYVFINSGNSFYDFSDALTKVWGADQKYLDNGIYGMYAGDINQDGSTDFNDYPDLDISSSNGELGYLVYDLNGDASVDFNDYPIIDINSSNGAIYSGTWIPPYTGIPNLHVGDLFAGGVVAYILQQGDQGYVAGEVHGLIAAYYDQGYGEWGCNTTNIAGTSVILGKGKINTDDIMNNCSQTGTAAELCDNLVLNGYSDWFLPSKNELEKVYQIRNYTNNFQNYYYWSSSQDTNTTAWLKNFNGGVTSTGNKNGNYAVRAVRYF